MLHVCSRLSGTWRFCGACEATAVWWTSIVCFLYFLYLRRAAEWDHTWDIWPVNVRGPHSTTNELHEGMHSWSGKEAARECARDKVRQWNRGWVSQCEIKREGVEWSKLCPHLILLYAVGSPRCAVLCWVTRFVMCHWLVWWGVSMETKQRVNALEGITQYLWRYNTTEQSESLESKFVACGIDVQLSNDGVPLHAHRHSGE